MSKKNWLEKINEQIKEHGLLIDEDYYELSDFVLGFEEQSPKEKLKQILNQGEEMKIVYVAAFLKSLGVEDDFGKTPVAALREIALKVDTEKESLIAVDLFEDSHFQAMNVYRYIELKGATKRYIKKNKSYFEESDPKYKIKAMFNEDEALEEMSQKIWDKRKQFTEKCNRSEKLKSLYTQLLTIIE